MIISPKIHLKKSVYKSSLGADLLQFGTKLDFLSELGISKITIKNNWLEAKNSSNPEWEFQFGNLAPHSEKSFYFSMGYLSIPDCKITRILTVYEWAFQYGLRPFIFKLVCGSFDQGVVS